MKPRRMGGACNTHGRDEKCNKNLVGKPEGERSLGGDIIRKIIKK
jgi:hypothetical protein